MKKKILENLFEFLYTGAVIGMVMVLFYFLLMSVLTPLVMWFLW